MALRIREATDETPATHGERRNGNRRDVAPLGKRLYRRLATGFAFYFTSPMPATKMKMPHPKVAKDAKKNGLSHNTFGRSWVQGAELVFGEIPQASETFAPVAE
jgi:hypothetical protein